MFDANTGKKTIREDLLKLPRWVLIQIDAYLNDKSLKRQLSDLVPGRNYNYLLNNPDLARCREFTRRELTKNFN